MNERKINIDFKALSNIYHYGAKAAAILMQEQTQEEVSEIVNGVKSTYKTAEQAANIAIKAIMRILDEIRKEETNERALSFLSCCHFVNHYLPEDIVKVTLESILMLFVHFIQFVCSLAHSLLLSPA